MSTKGIYNREKFRKLASRMDSPFIEEAKTAANMALDELAKSQNLRFSTEYGLGNEDAADASVECAKLRAQLAEAFESVARHETTTKQLEETIDRLHENMAEIDDHFQSVPPVDPPQPSDQSPVMPYDWGTADDNLIVDTGRLSHGLHSGPFPWKTLGTWAYGFASVFWLALVCSPDWRNTYRLLFFPLLWAIAGVPGFIYLRKIRDDYGWVGVAVKVCLSADLLLLLMLLLVLFDRVGYPHLTTREQVFSFVVYAGSLWFLYSERFFLWVLNERKRTQFVVFPGAAFILLLGVAWVTASDTKPVKAAAPTQQSSQSPHARKHRSAPKPTPPPDDPPQTLNYDFELPARNTSSPVLLESSYSRTAERPALIASAFQTAPPSNDGSRGGLLTLFVIGGFFALCAFARESRKQKQKRYQKALDEANAPLTPNETGNAGHASTKDLKKRGWA